MKKIILAIMSLVLSIALYQEARADYRSPEEYRQVIDSMTDQEIDELQRIVWLEARGESFDGQRAVVEVVCERVISSRFPNTVHEVLSQKGQFSTWRNRASAHPGEIQSDVILAVYEEEPVLPRGYLFFSTGRHKYAHDYIKLGGHWFGK